MVTITYKSNRANVVAAIKEAGKDGINEGAIDVLMRAEMIVPLDESPLLNSGKITNVGDSTYIGFGFGESAIYAVVQHENMQYAHAPGRQPKYLEQPFREQRDKIIQRVANKIRARLTRIG
jgi:hypothetical protein